MHFAIEGASGTKSTTYTYKGFNRATEKRAENGTINRNRLYRYDDLNRLQWVKDFDPAIDLTLPDLPDPETALRTVSYGYDPNGNTLYRDDDAATDDSPSLEFTYDARNQLISSRLPGTTGEDGVQGRYDYNAEGLRVRHLGSDRGDVEYFYDDRSVLVEREEASQSLLAHYRYADRLIRLDTATAGEQQYYHHDAMGSTVALSDAVGAVQKSYRLDPWGHVTNEYGTSVNRRVFTGHERDVNTGLVYMGARYYDPDSGRFLTQDTVLGAEDNPPSLHRYLYAYGNPFVYWDPTGRQSVPSQEVTAPSPQTKGLHPIRIEKPQTEEGLNLGDSDDEGITSEKGDGTAKEERVDARAPSTGPTLPQRKKIRRLKRKALKLQPFGPFREGMIVNPAGKGRALNIHSREDVEKFLETCVTAHTFLQ